MACRERGAAVAVPGSAWAGMAGLGCSPACVGAGAPEGPAAVPVGQGGCSSPTGLSVQAEQGPCTCAALPDFSPL